MNESVFEISPDGWVQVTPCGEYPHKGAGVVQVIDCEACEKMAAHFKNRQATEANFPGLLVDFDHFSLDTDKSSEAAGWVNDLEARDDGLWANVRWSSSGLAAVTGGRFRLVSPVFRHPGGTEDLGGGRVRPVLIENLALTNEPNIKGGVPIANRKPAEPARFMWLLGKPAKGPHCQVCLDRNGQVKTKAEWDALGHPACQCYCRLAEVGKDVPEGFKAPPPDPDMVLKKHDDEMANRWHNPEAWMKSLEVRRAKAAARKAALGSTAPATAEEWMAQLEAQRTAGGLGGTYADGTPVIRDMTDPAGFEVDGKPGYNQAGRDTSGDLLALVPDEVDPYSILTEMPRTGNAAMDGVNAFIGGVALYGGLTGSWKGGRYKPSFTSLQKSMRRNAELQVKRDLAAMRAKKTGYNQLLPPKAKLYNAYEVSDARKIYEKIAEPFSASRTIITAFDLSAMLRQGGVPSISNPLLVPGAFADMLKAFASEEAAVAADAKLKARPQMPMYRTGGLYLTDGPVGPRTLQEEVYTSSLAHKVPGVKISERAYNAYLNRIRADLFDSMVNSLCAEGTPTTRELKAIGNYVNAATGRGDLGAMNKYAAELSTVFFAPRLVASRFQMLLGQPMYGGTGRTRKLIAEQYGRYMLGVALIYALHKSAGGDDVEFDPASSDFGKLRYGPVRVDILSGLSQNAVALARLSTGRYMGANGEVTDLYAGPSAETKKKDAGDVGSRFVRTKLSPLFSGVVNLSTGKDLNGQPANLRSVAYDMTVPLVARDMIEVYNAMGIPEATALSLASVLGAGVAVYEDKKAKTEKDLPDYVPPAGMGDMWFFVDPKKPFKQGQPMELRDESVDHPEDRVVLCPRCPGTNDHFSWDCPKIPGNVERMAKEEAEAEAYAQKREARAGWVNPATWDVGVTEFRDKHNRYPKPEDRAEVIRLGKKVMSELDSGYIDGEKVMKSQKEMREEAAVARKVANRWALPWGDKARARSLEVRRAKAAARKAAAAAAGFDQTYADGTPVIKDLTELPPLTEGTTMSAEIDPDRVAAEEAYRRELQAIAERYQGVSDSIDNFNALVAAFAGMGGAAGGAAAPLGAASRAFGVPRYGGFKTVRDASGTQQGWAKAGPAPYGRSSAARRSSKRPPYDESIARGQKEFIEKGPSPAARPGEPGYGKPQGLVHSYGVPEDVAKPATDPFGMPRRATLPSFGFAFEDGGRYGISSDPLNNPQTPADFEFRDSYSRHLDEIRSELSVGEVDELAKRYDAFSPAPMAAATPAAMLKEAGVIYDTISKMAQAEDLNAAQNEQLGSLYDLMRRFKELYEADMPERIEKEDILGGAWKLLWDMKRAGRVEVPEIPSRVAEAAVAYKTLGDIPPITPETQGPPIDLDAAVDGILGSAKWAGAGDQASGDAVFGPDGVNSIYVEKAHPEAALEAARALGILHGVYNVPPDDSVAGMSSAMLEEYDAGRAEGAAGYNYGVRVPKDRAGVLRRAQTLLKFGAVTDEEYGAEHLSGVNQRKWQAGSDWNVAGFEGKIPDTRMNYSPESLLTTAMNWFKDATVRGEKGEANAALAYMNDLMLDVAADKAAITEAGRPGEVDELADETDTPEVDTSMPVYDEDGVEVQTEAPLYEDSLADPRARQPWDYEQGDLFGGVAAPAAPAAPSAPVKLSGSGPYASKDQAKADQANKFIGRGSAASSTARYAADWGDRANTGQYVAGDRVFVSVEGNRPGRVGLDCAEVGKAVAAGATIIADNADDRGRSYNVGERELAEFLQSSGYQERAPGSGEWVPASAPVRRADPLPAPRPAKVSQATPASIEAARKWRLEAARKLTMGEVVPGSDGTRIRHVRNRRGELVQSFMANRDRHFNAIMQKAGLLNRDESQACLDSMSPASSCKCQCGGHFHGLGKMGADGWGDDELLMRYYKYGIEGMTDEMVLVLFDSLMKYRKLPGGDFGVAAQSFLDEVLSDTFNPDELMPYEVSVDAPSFIKPDKALWSRKAAAAFKEAHGKEPTTAGEWADAERLADVPLDARQYATNDPPKKAGGAPPAVEVVKAKKEELPPTAKKLSPALRKALRMKMNDLRKRKKLAQQQEERKTASDARKKLPALDIAKARDRMGSVAPSWKVPSSLPKKNLGHKAYPIIPPRRGGSFSVPVTPSRLYVAGSRGPYKAPVYPANPWLAKV